jgi:5-oxopent-3-ene-1,2,5-tricarboxylate decarboxylase / 2-hydroxyhepta-2,4-diene-1,7-dioate isomerase
MTSRVCELTDELKAQFNSVSTATIVNQLQRRGIRSTFLSGVIPLVPGKRVVGYAYTLRYLPMREDLQPVYASGINAQRVAVENVGVDEVIVMDARSVSDAGTLGDIFAMRAQMRGAAAMVTDGATRDTPALRAMGFPVYSRAAHAATWGRMHLPIDTQIPIACAGVTVIPGDIVVGDDEGIAIVPAALAAEVATDSVQQELEETWAFQRVSAGESSTGTFPISKERRPEFEAWAEARKAGK